MSTATLQLSRDLGDLTEKLNEALDDTRDYGRRKAEAERDYRKARSRAWVESASAAKLSKHREAWVDAETADARHERDLAEAMWRHGLERERAIRAEISALQTLANAEREEAAFARTGPES